MPYARVKNELPIIPGYASGDIVSFSDGAVAPLNMLKTSIAPSLQGYSSATVTRTDGQEPPVISDTETASFGQTIYGGDVDLLEGNALIKYYNIDLGSLTWSYGASAAGTMLFISTSIYNIKSPSFDDLPDIICEEYDIKSWRQLNTGPDASNGMCIYDNGSVRIVDSNYTDPATFKAHLSGVMMTYGLRIPVTGSFTPIEMNTLPGENKISADCGPIDLIYIRRSDS